MKLQIDLRPEHYKYMLKRVPKNSLLFKILKNALIKGKQTNPSLIRIPCEYFQATVLLNLAQLVCPEAVPSIESAIATARKSN